MVSAKLALLKNKPAAPAKPKLRATTTTVSKNDYYEFIPYHNHFNPHTLMTKDGELVQIIKIEGNARGGNCENLDGLHATIRDVIRHSLPACDLSEKIGFWIHVIRKRREFDYKPKTPDAGFTDSFAGYVNSKWEKTSKFEHSYYNEIYITLMHDGQIAPLVPDKAVGKSIIFPKENRRVRNEYLDNLQVRMDALTDDLVEKLSSHCTARRLSLYERPLPDTGIEPAPSIFYSELLELYANIFNLRSERIALRDVNLSFAVQTTDLEFGFNTIMASSKKDGSKRYGTMLSLKQYRDMPSDTIDRVLQAPIEMIIGQSFVVMPSKKALKHYSAQKELFDMSGDTAANEIFGINEMFASDRKGKNDFGEQQISIMVMADGMKRMDKEISTFQSIFADLGLVLVREDIRTEEVFWAQFPGNFEFVRRKDTVAMDKVAGFCRLNRFHEGSLKNNHWGEAVSIIPTSVGSPYAFSFHVEDNGHTSFFDFNSFEDKTGSALQYFLLTQTRKFGARIFVFDRNQSARLWLNKMGGSYFTMTQLLKANRDRLEDKSPIVSLNPFTLEDNKYNKSFLAAWCGLLISPYAILDEEKRVILRAAVGELYELPKQDRNLKNMVAVLRKSDEELAKPLEEWFGAGACAGLFDAAQDSINMNLDILGFDMNPAITSNQAFLLPLFSYLMHKVIESVDSRPTIIVLNEAWDLLENTFFAPRLESLLEMLRQRNVMVVFSTSKVDSCKSATITPTIMSACATQIYVPDEMPVGYSSDEISLGAHDAVLLLDMSRQKGDFLIKQKGESVALHAYLEDAEDAIAIFSNDIKSLGSARGKFASIPKDY